MSQNILSPYFLQRERAIFVYYFLCQKVCLQNRNFFQLKIFWLLPNSIWFNYRNWIFYSGMTVMTAFFSIVPSQKCLFWKFWKKDSKYFDYFIHHYCRNFAKKYDKDNQHFRVLFNDSNMQSWENAKKRLKIFWLGYTSIWQ